MVVDAIQKAVGAATHTSRTTIPSVYGAQVPNMTDHLYISTKINSDSLKSRTRPLQMQHMLSPRY